jgi:HNH endonuclease
MPVLRICAYEPCSQPFLISPSRVHHGAAKYCSRPCQYAAQRQSISCICIICQTVFTTVPANIRKGAGKYCSRQCYDRSKRHTPENFWSHVSICAHGKECPFCCWPWQGTMKNGYGVLTFESQQFYTHRIAWELWHQTPMPKELFAAHYCHNRGCNSPGHIHPATQQDNIADSVRDKRMSHGTHNHKSKLVEVNISEIFVLRQQGWLLREIAQRFSVTPTNIGDILHRQTWRHVPIPDHLLPH